ncbi:WD40 repeat-containing protein, partial [Reticulomyxa filosa]
TREKTTKSDEVKTDEKDIDNSVEVLMQSELFAPELVTSELKITQNTTWLGNPKSVDVNGVECASFTVTNLILLARRRNSHVPKEVKEALSRKKKMLKEKAMSNSGSSSNLNSPNTDDTTANLANPFDPNDQDSTAESNLDNEQTNNNRSRHLSTTNSSSSGLNAKKSKTPRPFAGKKQKLSEYVKKYDYPKWQPPQISIEQYFKLAKPQGKIAVASSTTPLARIPEEDKNKKHEPAQSSGGDEEEEEEEDDDGDDNNNNNQVNFLTNPVVDPPMSSGGSSILSRMFQKKKKQQTQNTQVKEQTKCDELQ